MKNKIVSIKIILLIVFIDMLESVYELFFKKGMNGVGAFDFSDMSVAFRYVSDVVSNRWIWLGFAIIVIETVLWFAVLAKIDLSLAFPLASSSYIFVLITSAVFLNENVSVNRLIGTVMIMVGIIVVTKSSESGSIDG